MGFAGVGVWVGLFVPQHNPYPTSGYTGTSAIDFFHKFKKPEMFLSHLTVTISIGLMC